MKTFLLFLVLLTNQAFCANYAFFAGGGENSPFESQFDVSFGMLSTLLPQKTWKVEYLYKYKSEKTKPFTAEAFRDQMDALDAKIQSEEIKSKDQIMIYFNSHGAHQTDGEFAHSIQGLNLQTVDLNRLKTLIEATERRGIKLAIIDQSCFSGALTQQGYGKKNTCIISSTTKDNLGYSSDADKFAFELQNAIRKSPQKQNLESLFLSSRSGSATAAQPMISSFPGEQASIYLSTLENPMAYSNTASLRDQYVCHQESPEWNEKVQEMIQILLKSTFINPKQRANIENLNQRSQFLKARILKERGSVTDWLKEQNKLICQQLVLPTRDGLGKMSTNKCMSYAELKEYGQNQIELWNATLENDSRLTKEQKDRALAERDVLIKMFASHEYKGIDEKSNTVSVTKFDQLVKDLATTERDLYQELYSYFKTQEKTKPNPCRDFILN